MVVLFYKLKYKLKNPSLQNRGECVFVIISAALYILSNFVSTFINFEYALWIPLVLKFSCIISF